MVFIKSGEFMMGSDDGMPLERPVHKVSIDSFWIDSKEVTVAEFAEFVTATNYKTEAEKFGWSGVFDMNLGEWTRGDNATWRNPDGDWKQAFAKMNPLRKFRGMMLPNTQNGLENDSDRSRMGICGSRRFLEKNIMLGVMNLTPKRKTSRKLVARQISR